MLKGDLKNLKNNHSCPYLKKQNPITSITLEEKVRPDFSQLASRWPSAFVARDSIREFSGGMITPGYLANLDSLGDGPAGKVRCGRKIAYPVTEVVKWLEKRSEVV